MPSLTVMMRKDDIAVGFWVDPAVSVEPVMAEAMDPKRCRVVGRLMLAAADAMQNRMALEALVRDGQENGDYR